MNRPVESITSRALRSNSTTKHQASGSATPTHKVLSLFSLTGAVSVLALMLPVTPAIAASDGDYRQCASSLIGRNITPEEAVDACARALQPRELSRCVNEISQESPISATNALSACRQVRRPVEMASCVVDIRKGVTGVADLDVLDRCRLSLLPDRYSSCVTGLSRETQLSATQVLDSCIDAGYFPREVDPTFIPYGATPPAPMTPSDTLLTPSTPLTPLTPLTPTPPANPATPTTPTAP